MDFVQHYGPCALIVGGSEGVGAAFARQLAREGLDLLLVARNAPALDTLRADIRAAHPGRDVRILAADLSVDAGAQIVIEAARNLEIGLLIYNAGACSRRENFLASDYAFHQRLVTLNVMNKMRIVHELGQAMKERSRGGILLIGSTAMAGGVAGFATYGAAKAFSALFAEALWYELRPAGIHVLGYVLGAVETPAMARNYPEAIGRGASPDQVAAFGLTRLAEGPILYAEGVEQDVRAIVAMPRGPAVDFLTQSTSMYKEWPPARQDRGATHHE